MRVDGCMKKFMVVLLGLVVIFVGVISGCTQTKSPINKSEIDTDGDGVSDALDAFPLDANETRDSDGDGVGDHADAFPFDMNETKDSDGDGVGDHADAFPFDPTEWLDSDGDGVGDNADDYPFDPTRWEQSLTDPFVLSAEPYIEKLVLNDGELQAYISTVVNGCDSSSNDCMINALYRDVLMNYTCVPAVLGTAPLQTPQATIQTKEGTCEDLSILLCSLLSNVGVRSYLVFTNDHVYALACDVDTDALWGVAEQSLLNRVEGHFGEPLLQPFHQTYMLGPRNMLYAGGELAKTFGDYIDFMTIDFTVASDLPVHLLVVPTQAEFFALRDGDLANFSQLTQYEEVNLTSKTGVIPEMTTYGGIILLNEGTQVATVTVDLLFSFQASFYHTYNKNRLTSYNVNGKEAVLLDPTLDEYGFPGYDAQVMGVKKAIDPISKVYITLP